MTILRIPCIALVAAAARAGSGSLGQLEQPVRHDLPAQPEAVLEPAALRFLAAVDQPVPVVVDLVLVLALDHERHRLGELEMRAAVDADEPRAVQHEEAGQHVAWRRPVRLRWSGGAPRSSSSGRSRCRTRAASSRLLSNQSEGVMAGMWGLLSRRSFPMQTLLAAETDQDRPFGAQRPQREVHHAGPRFAAVPLHRRARKSSTPG